MLVSKGVGEVDGSGQSQAQQSSSRLSAPAGSKAAVRFIVDSKRRLVIARFGERVTATDIVSYARNLCRHPGFDPSFSEIADISEAKEMLLEGPDFLKLADSVDPFSAQSKRAFVAQSPVQMHAARMHKILRSQRNFRIFQTPEEAECWITG